MTYVRLNDLRSLKAPDSSQPSGLRTLFLFYPSSSERSDHLRLLVHAKELPAERETEPYRNGCDGSARFVAKSQRLSVRDGDWNAVTNF